MSSSTLFRLSAVAGMLSGLALAIGAVLAVPATWLYAQILYTLSAVLFLCLLPAAYLVQRQESGALGGLGFIVALLAFCS